MPMPPFRPLLAALLPTVVLLFAWSGSPVRIALLVAVVLVALAWAAVRSLTIHDDARN